MFQCDNNGFSILEAVIAIFIVAIILVSVMYAVTSFNGNNQKNLTQQCLIDANNYITGLCSAEILSNSTINVGSYQCGNTIVANTINGTDASSFQCSAQAGSCADFTVKSNIGTHSFSKIVRICR